MKATVTKSGHTFSSPSTGRLMQAETQNAKDAIRTYTRCMTQYVTCEGIVVLFELNVSRTKFSKG